MADWLSQYMTVGPLGGKPRSVMMAHMCRACFAAATAARNSASVELVAVMDCVLHQYEMAPPHGRKAYPVVDRRLRRSLACAASRNATGSWVSTVGNSGSSASIVERMKLEGGRDVSGWDRR